MILDDARLSYLIHPIDGLTRIVIVDLREIRQHIGLSLRRVHLLPPVGIFLYVFLRAEGSEFIGKIIEADVTIIANYRFTARSSFRSDQYHTVCAIDTIDRGSR